MRTERAHELLFPTMQRLTHLLSTRQILDALELFLQRERGKQSVQQALVWADRAVSPSTGQSPASDATRILARLQLAQQLLEFPCLLLAAATEALDSSAWFVYRARMRSQRGPTRAPQDAISFAKRTLVEKSADALAHALTLPPSSAPLYALARAWQRVVVTAVCDRLKVGVEVELARAAALPARFDYKRAVA